MGDWSSPVYIASQILVIFAYTCSMFMYFMKNRTLMLAILLGANGLRSISFLMLAAWVGAVVTAIALARTATDYVINSRRSPSDRKRIFPIDWCFLVFWFIAFTTVTIFTYDNHPISLLPLISTLAFTVAIWQKNVLAFKIAAVPCSAAWILYNVYVESMFGVIMESALCLVIIAALIIYIKSERKTNAYNYTIRSAKAE